MVPNAAKVVVLISLPDPLSTAARESEHRRTYDVLAEQSADAARRTSDFTRSQRAQSHVRIRRGLIARVLILADVTALTIAFVCSEVALGGHDSPVDQVSLTREVALFVLTLPLWVSLAATFHLYRRDQHHPSHSAADEIPAAVTVVTVGTWLFILGSWITGLADPWLPKVALFWISALLLFPILRMVARRWARQTHSYVQNAIVIGAGDVGQLLAVKLQRHPEYGFNVVGFLDSNPKERRDDLAELEILGELADLTSAIRRFEIDRVFVAFSDERAESLVHQIRLMGLDGIQVDVVPRCFDVLGPNATPYAIEGFPLIGVLPPDLSLSARRLKRLLDLALSIAALAVLFPLLLVLALFIAVDSPGPVIYRHRRLGLRGQRIDILKFRTMRLEWCAGEKYGGASAEKMFGDLMADAALKGQFASNHKLRRDPRVTRVGRFLRTTSFDELPQLINVLKGELSLVGPRPITEQELERYDPWTRLLLQLRPGVTGLWQVSGRSNLDYEERVRLDLIYASNWSLALDMQILAKTLRALTAGAH